MRCDGLFCLAESSRVEWQREFIRWLSVCVLYRTGISKGERFRQLEMASQR